MNFENTFGEPAHTTVVTPGRVNLIGEHTDYNQGFVLPMPVRFFTTVSVGKNETQFEVYAAQFKEFQTFELTNVIPTSWLNYVVGSLKELAKSGFVLPGAKIFIDSNIPMGAGLSSSAALCIALLKAFRALGGFSLDDKKIVHMAQQVEWNYAGVKCGLMDQMAVSFGQANHALCIDMRYLISDNISVPSGAKFVVIDSKVQRTLADSGYNERRFDCELAATELKVNSLREISILDLAKLETLPDELKRRARHVVTENHRVLEAAVALREKRLIDFGHLMLASHRSLRDDFEVSHPTLDCLVDAAITQGALGARLTGGGFGGSVIALLDVSQADSWSAAMTSVFPDIKILTIS